MRYGHSSGYVLGFHGCDKETAERVFSGGEDLLESTNNHDWLGHGIYFWEANLERAKRWAVERMTMPGSSIQNPDVVGAVLDLGHCFSLLQTDHLETLQGAYTTLSEVCSASEIELPRNTGGDDRFLRRLDCAVMQMLHHSREAGGDPSFDSVRGLFPEGEELYPNAGFWEGNHIQICIRNRHCIKGYFRPIED